MNTGDLRRVLNVGPVVQVVEYPGHEHKETIVYNIWSHIAAAELASRGEI